MVMEVQEISDFLITLLPFVCYILVILLLVRLLKKRQGGDDDDNMFV